MINAMTKELKRVLFLTTPPIMELDLIGPLSVFQTANYLLTVANKAPCYQVEVITSEPEKIVVGNLGLSLLAHHTIKDLPLPLAEDQLIDTLLVVGGSGSTAVKPTDPVALWLQQVSLRTRRIGSICTGAFVLAAAGLLQQRRATTHWNYCARLSTQYPQIKVDSNPIFIQDGNIFTSAGVTTGMDLALELVEQDLGGAIALDIARALVIFLRRPGGQNQFSVTLTAATSERQALKDLPAWILEHIAEPLPIEALAHQAAMSLRHFARVFAAEFGMTPARYVLAQRIEAARRALAQTDLGQKEIAQRCGFGNTEHMRRAFLRITGIAPSTYRDHFRHNSKVEIVQSSSD